MTKEIDRKGWLALVGIIAGAVVLTLVALGLVTVGLITVIGWIR